MLSFLNRIFPSRTRARHAHKQAPSLHEVSASWLVVGLGNPGPAYEATRHNVGFMALDELAGDSLEPLPGLKAHLAVRGGVAYLKPTTFMNLSGEAVAPLAKRLGIDSDHIIVLHDELDLPAGTVRLRRGGSENGHNGLKSISEELGTRDYVRVRIGIGRPRKGTPVIDWVLGEVDGDISDQIALAAEATRLIVASGLAKAQNSIHARS